MTLPNIDTFEHDISEEIKTREASVSDIASAGGEVGNAAVKTTPTPLIATIFGGLFLIAVLVIGIVWYVKTTNSSGTTGAQAAAVASAPTVTIRTISPTIDSAIGPSLGTTQRSEFGYTVAITAYSPVFAYMLKNESSYADEIAQAVGSSRDTSTTSPPFTFTDETLNNQNMRVGTSGSSTVVYAFVNTQYLLIAQSTDDILKLRSAILH